MSIEDDGKQNSQSAKVLQLGFNISVSGDPGTDFQIVLDDEGQKRFQSSQNEISLPLSDNSPIKASELDTSKTELEIDNQEVESVNEISAKLKNIKETPTKFSQKSDSSSSKESNIISEIKNTLEHFERFSDHFKDAPRLRTSTPVSDNNIYKSDSNLLYSEFRPRKFSHLYDYHYKKNYYFNRPSKPPDLFLKPLPGENLYRSGCYGGYKSTSIRQYVSDSSLNKTTDYKPDYEKFKFDDLSSDIPGILKKFDGESGDKQSTSSGESIKDIKIYQSGGILIMQNFKENMDAFEKSEISNFNAQLIERLNVLKDETTPKGNKKGPGLLSEEGRNSGKMVQFDLSGFESQKSKSNDSSFSASKDEKSPNKQGSSESVSNIIKNKDSSPQNTSQCQDFPSLSTIENESTISNQFGLSPTYSSTKKLEWDSGADVGYYNSDPSKENLSSIEKFVLSNLSSNLLDESSLGTELSKFTHVKMASDKLMNEIREERKQEHREFMEKRSKEKIDKGKMELSDNEVVKNNEAGTSREGCKPKLLVKQISTDNPIQSQGKERKSIESIDKSVNVNTLFETVDLNPENRNINSEALQKLDISKENKKSHRKPSPKARKYRKSNFSPRKITWAPKKRTSLSPCKTHELPVVGMGVPKKTYKKVDGNPEIRDVESSREVEEKIIDQRFKIKQNVSSVRENKKPNEDTEEKENKPKRPVSGSSSSNNTVLPNIENKETEKKDVNKFSDQIIQTVGLDCESVGVQAFESQKSSACNSKKEEQPKAPEKVPAVQLSSKNTQAFGLNASLPKQLAHPKQSIFSKNQLTKGTQFFGERNNSLPRRFAAPGRIASVRIPGQPAYMTVTEYLNSLKTPEHEVIQLNEENKKSNEGNDSPKTNSKKSRSDKNKENLFSENTKKSQSQKTKSTPEKKDSDRSYKKTSPTMEDPEYVHTSDEVSSKVLTSEVLKEHGDSIDRNIIQEKYFQSQLIELKKREMVSRSTSIDSQIEGGRPEKECVTVGCQYSSCSKDSTSKSKDVPEDKGYEEESKEKGQGTDTTDQYDYSQNIMGGGDNSKSTNQGQLIGDSLPSSTQTANSWIAVENPEQDKSGVGRATSFEYLPGHIYESSGNLRELESETEQNLTTSCSSESNSGKVSTNKGGKDSEGRNTLILENSTDNSHDSDQLKILDENLTQLNLIVSKLWEKEAEVKSMNESLFVKLLHRNGSGDFLGHTNSLQTEVLNEETLAKHGNGKGDCGNPWIRQKTSQEISTACQTDDKSSSDPEKFYNERKALEKRISEEKESQIKWIENEIRHLNILRELLEKQSLSHQRKKRHSLASETPSCNSKTDPKDSNENYPRPVTPVYGCTISLSRNGFLEENLPTAQETNNQEQREHEQINSENPQYGMSVLLKNTAEDTIKNFQGVVTLPVGLQISLKGNETEGECSNSEGNNEKRLNSFTLSGGNGSPEHSRQEDSCAQNNISTQMPSSRKPSQTLPSTAAQTDNTSGKCDQCRRRNCYCLCLSERSSPSKSQSSKMTERRESLQYNYKNDELTDVNKTSSSTDQESYPPPKSPIRMKLDNREESPGHRCAHKIQDCRKYLERGQSPSNKYVSKGVCKNPCQSHVVSQYEKSIAEFPSCHCSKVQVQKYSTCSCQIIKIVGSQCLRDSGPRALKKQTSKTTENQSSQTDEVTIVTKDLIKSPVLIKPAKARDIHYPSESKIAIEKKNVIVENQSVVSKVPFEKRHSLDNKIEIREKVSMLKKSPEVQTPVQEKHLEGVPHIERPEQDSSISEKVEKIAKALQEGWTCTCYEAYQKDTSKDRRLDSIKKEATRDRLDSSREESCEKESLPIGKPQEDDSYKSRRNGRLSGQEMPEKRSTSFQEERCEEEGSIAASHNYHQEPSRNRNIRSGGQEIKKKKPETFQGECYEEELLPKTTAQDYDHYHEEIRRRNSGQEAMKKKPCSYQEEVCEEESSSIATPHDYCREPSRKRNSRCIGQEVMKNEPTPFQEEVFEEGSLPMAAPRDGDYYPERRNPRTCAQGMIKKKFPLQEEETIKKKPTKDKDLEKSSDELFHELNKNDEYHDHPRHYFLKIEETEVDDSNESLEPRKPVEVITVKVPVKKAGKGKIHKPDRSKSYHTSQYSLKSEDTPKLCVCCKNCKVYEKKPIDYSSSREYRRTQAEKPHSPMRISTPHGTPVNSGEKMGWQCSDSNYQTYKEEAFCPELPYERSTMVTPEHLHKKEERMEYDSHKKSRKKPYKKGVHLFEREPSRKRQEDFQSRDAYENEFELNNEDSGVRIEKPQRHSGMGGPRDDYYNYDKKEYKTRSELLKEEWKRGKTLQPSLQESLYTNRPDFYHNAERRRQVITEKAKDRAEKQSNKADFLMNLMHCINENNPSRNQVEKRLFTSAEMREQTRKRYKDLPETVEKISDRKKKAEHMTNRILADIYSKKLQIEALKGHINLSNSISVLATI